MTKEEIFESLKNLKKPVIVHMFKTVYEDRDEAEYMHKITVRNLQSRIAKLEEENAKLQEQLKNVIVPKFKIGDEVYHIRSWNEKILKAKVKSISVRINEYNTNFEYGLSDWCECETDKRYCNFVSSVADEEFVFATEAEAQKHLEDKNEN